MDPETIGMGVSLVQPQLEQLADALGIGISRLITAYEVEAAFTWVPVVGALVPAAALIGAAIRFFRMGRKDSDYTAMGILTSLMAMIPLIFLCGTLNTMLIAMASPEAYAVRRIMESLQ